MQIPRQRKLLLHKIVPGSSPTVDLFQTLFTTTNSSTRRGFWGKLGSSEELDPSESLGVQGLVPDIGHTELLSNIPNCPENAETGQRGSKSEPVEPAPPDQPGGGGCH